MRARKEGKTHAGAQNDLILIYVSRRGGAISIISLHRPRSRHGFVCHGHFGIIERRIDAARDRPTDKFTGSSGGIMRRRRSPTMGDSVRPYSGPPFSRIIPTSTSLVGFRRGVCAPSVPLGTRRLKFLSRGSPLYIFRYKFGCDSRSPQLWQARSSIRIDEHHPRRSPLIFRIYC